MIDAYLQSLTWWAFALQAIALVAYLPLSYLTYRAVCLKKRRKDAMEALSQMGMGGGQEEALMQEKIYRPAHYGWPLLLASLFTLGIFTAIHPYPISQGVTAGFSQEVINVFGLPSNNLLDTAIFVGHIGLWGFMGAYVYALQLLFQRLMDYDLTPKVYLYITRRFVFATVLGTVVGMALATFNTAAGLSFDVNAATVGLVAFFVGFFPERGLDWVVLTAQKTLNLRGRLTRETHLGEIDGLSVWHQARLRQEGIENVQNMATADITTLVVLTPFTANQIVDWVNQAVLIAYASPDQRAALASIGLRCATDVLIATDNETHLDHLAEATGLNRNGLNMLSLALQSAPSMGLMTYFTSYASLDGQRRVFATEIKGKATPGQSLE